MTTADPLQRADALRQHEPAKAAALYQQHLDGIDPCDKERVAWLAEQRPALPACETLFRRCVEDAGDPELRLAAINALAYLMDDCGRLDEAREFFKTLVHETRDTDRESWVRHCLNLANSYRMAGRAFECLVLARHTARAAREIGHRFGEAVAHLHTCGVMNDLRDAPRLRDALRGLERALGHVEGDARASTLRALAMGYWGEYHRIREDWAEALRWCDEHDAALPKHPGVAHYRVENQVHRARSLIGLGDVPGAKQELDRAARGGLERPTFLLLLDMTRLELALRGSSDDARVFADEVMRTLAEESASIGCGTVIEYGMRLARLFGRRLPDFDKARQAFDLVAAASLERVVELDRCIRELPELGEWSARDEETLMAYRHRFRAEQQAMFRAVKRYLETAAGGVADLLLEDGLMAVCAWCQRVRVEGERWVPVTAFSPRQEHLEVRQGMCESCAKSYPVGHEAEAAFRS